MHPPWAEVESDAESVASTVPAFWLQGGLGVRTLEDIPEVYQNTRVGNVESEHSGRSLELADEVHFAASG